MFKTQSDLRKANCLLSVCSAALLLGNQVMVTVSNGQPVLGRYQDVILVELDGPRQRKVALQWLSA